MISLRDRLTKLCEKSAVTALYAFGSRAKEAVESLGGDAPMRRDTISDLDIGVLVSRETHLDVRQKASLIAKLEDLFDVGRVDLVVLPEASAFLALDVLRGELLVDLDPDETARFELYVLRRAGDLSFFERQRRSMVLNEGAV